jgi:predicted aspartyl protease
MRFSYDSTYLPPAPSIEIRLGLPGGDLTIGPVKAFVDTGADGTIVPLKVLKSLKAASVTRGFIRSQWGERRSIAMYRVELAFGTMRLPLVDVVSDSRGSEIILGRNVLNGPRQTLEVRG